MSEEWTHFSEEPVLVVLGGGRKLPWVGSQDGVM